MARGLNNPDLEDFLQRVDELESVVQGEAALAGPHEGGISPAGRSVNVRQQREPVDRTVINHTAFRNDNKQGIRRNGTPAGQDEFMRSLEADANERAENRRKRKEEATSLKEQGNQEFQKGNYDRAVELYTEGLERLKDFVVLYTNRAQAYNRLEKFTEAIEDCQTALHLEPTNIKALVHLGKAHQGLQDYDTAVQTYQGILKIDNKKQQIVKEYIEAARLAKSMAASATEAGRLFNEGDTKATGVYQIVLKLQQPNQPLPYYAGGMRILGVTLNDDSSRAQFRTFGGFNLLTNHSIIQQAFDDAAAGEDLMSSGHDLVCVTLDLLTSAVKDNEENVTFLLSLSTTPSLFAGLLSKASSGIRLCCINLLCTLSSVASGCQKIVERFDVFSLLTSLTAFLATQRERYSTLNGIANLLKNISQTKRFIERFSTTSMNGEFEEYSSAVTTLLLNNATTLPAALHQSICVMTTLASDRHLRFLMTSKKLLTAVIAAMETYTKKQVTPMNRGILIDLIVLLTNMFVDRCPMEDMGLQDEVKLLVAMTIPLLEQNEVLQQRSFHLLGRTLPNTIEGVAYVAKQNIIPKIVDVIKNSDVNCNNFAIKCLAVLTQRSEKARKDLVRTDKELKCIRKLLNGDNTISNANAALVIGHCTQVPGLSRSLVNSDVIMTLLSKTDTTSAALKENCAIALAKLATTDERHLVQLRELGGIGILNSCMKYIKS